jgi:hypothetical protein
LCANRDECIEAGGVWNPSSNIQSKMPKDTWSQIVGVPVRDSNKHYNVSCASQTGNQLLKVRVIGDSNDKMIIRKGNIGLPSCLYIASRMSPK